MFRYFFDFRVCNLDFGRKTNFIEIRSVKNIETCASSLVFSALSLIVTIIYINLFDFDLLLLWAKSLILFSKAL